MVYAGLLDVLLPPTGLLILLGLGLLSGHRCGRMLAGSMLVLLVVGAMPWVSDGLLALGEPPYQSLTADQAEAIVVLSAGVLRDQREYHGPSPKPLTLARLRYGAVLARQLRKPVLLSGGDPGHYGVAESQVMQTVMERELGVPVRWVETQSRTTRENARYAARMLEDAGIHRIYLVTSAWHLPRAIPEFERLGIHVVPAGTGYGDGTLAPAGLLPGPQGLQSLYYFFHERVGIFWYWCLDNIAGGRA